MEKRMAMGTWRGRPLEQPQAAAAVEKRIAVQIRFLIGLPI